MAITNEQILNWLQANPNATDAQIAQTAATAGVSAQQLAQVTGLSADQINARATAANPSLQLPAYVPPAAAPAPVTNTWNYDEYINALRTGGNLGEQAQRLATQDPTLAANASGLFNEMLGQQTSGLSPSWYQGNTASTQAATADFALRLAENGISSLSELGTYTIPGDGDIPAQEIIINKVTGQPLPRPELLGRGTRGLDLNYNLVFNDQGQATPYTSNRESSWMGFRENTLKPAAALAAAAYGASLLGGAGAAGAAGGAGAAGTGVTGMGLGTGISAGAGGLGLSTTGAAGLGINAGTGLTGTGILSGSTLGTGLLGAGTAGLAGLTGTGVLSGSTLGTELLGTTGTGALTNTGILTGSSLGTELLGTGAGTAATVGGVGGNVGANLGAGALDTGISAGLGGGGGVSTTTGADILGGGGSGLTSGQIANLVRAGLGLATTAGAARAITGGSSGGGGPTVSPTQGVPAYSNDYFNSLQQYYNSYMPNQPRDVVSPLQSWYAGSGMSTGTQGMMPSSQGGVTAPQAAQSTQPAAINAAMGAGMFSAPASNDLGNTMGTPMTAATPSNFLAKFMPGTQQNSPDYTTAQAQITKNPEVVKAIEDIYKLDPNHQLFTGTAGDLRPHINRLSSEMDRIGKPAALRNFYSEQQNLIGFGGDNWFDGQNMGNPQWAELQRKKMSQTPIANEQDWLKMAKRTVGDRPVENILRDPTSKLGVGIIMNERTNRPDTLGYFDRNGQLLRSSTFNKEDIYKNLEEFGFDLSNVGALGKVLTSKGVGNDLTNVTADLSETATPEWVDKQINHLGWQNRMAGSAGMFPSDTATQTRTQQIRQTHEMAKRLLSQRK
jgi:hypothetical protein